MPGTSPRRAADNARAPRRARPEALPSGRYSLSVYLGRDENGVRIRRRVDGDSPEDARANAAALLARHKAGLLAADPRAERESLAGLLRAWLENKDGTVQYSTWERYQFTIERHLIPLLGRTRIGELTPNDLRRAYRRLGAPPPAGLGLRPRSVQYAHVTVRQALAQAVQDGAVPRNVADVVSPPSVPAHEARALTVDEAGRLLELATEPWQTLWLVALYTGLREGELLGLTWPDVDAAHGTVTVRRALVKAPGGRAVLRPSPKTRAGVRVVPVPALVSEALQAHRLRQNEEKLRAGPAWEDADKRVFLTRNGTSPLPTNVIRTLKRDAARAGVAGVVGVHTLRHTFASSLLAAGRPVTEVAYLLGHGSAAVTLRIYAHWSTGADPSAAEALRRHYASAVAPPSPHAESPRTTKRPL